MTSYFPFQQHRAATTTTIQRDTRRQPFSNAGNQMPITTTKTAVVTPTKAGHVKQKPASPPLPRQNTKIAPPSPPQVIRDDIRCLQYHRVGFLGEGGFARVFEAEDRRGNRIAIKVVTKDSLKTKKAKTKLYAEIKIHRSLEHPNIVNFGDCFEDHNNVYMTLELCQSGSLMDMLRHRRRFTEPETRFFLVQLIGACNYMHSHQVIHRDLKLGNLFLDAEMNIKVGDFGLAALIENPGERKKTICGTPNYIAPEVLFDTANGHSFEVDTWSIGVILYTLVVGRPPFQTKEVKEIYKRIRANAYEFPSDRRTSPEVQDLVKAMLTPDPQQRPILLDVLAHDFFVNGIVPAYIPRTAQDRTPDFRNISLAQSRVNLSVLRKNALLDEEQMPGIAVPHPSVSAASGRSRSSVVNASLSSSVALAQQEREFHRAIQPGSPISALLGAARQPLVIAPSPTGTARSETGGDKERPLIRKLQLSTKMDGKSPSRPTSALRNVVNATNGQKAGLGLQNIEEEENYEEVEEQLRRKELESQKARIVAQMVPGPTGSGQNYRQTSSSPDLEDRENVPPMTTVPRSKQGTSTAPVIASRASTSSLHSSGFDAMAQTLAVAFDAKAKGRLFRDPREDANLPDPKVFIVSWVDYCNKYGMGYALTDGTVGVHFNDSTSIVLSPDGQHFDYISPKRPGLRSNFTVADYPVELKSKVYLLKHFEKYIMEKLYGEHPFTFQDLERTKGLDYVMKYLRMKHVIVFKLSHDVLQFNFFDHTKVILSSQGLVVTHIDKDYAMTQWTLSEIMQLALYPVDDPVEAKFNQRLADKLKYCKEVLQSIKNVSESGESVASNEKN